MRNMAKSHSKHEEASKPQVSKRSFLDFVSATWSGSAGAEVKKSFSSSSSSSESCGKKTVSDDNAAEDCLEM